MQKFSKFTAVDDVHTSQMSKCNGNFQIGSVKGMQLNKLITLYRLYSLLVPMQMLLSHQARLLGVSVKVTSPGIRGMNFRSFQ